MRTSRLRRSALCCWLTVAVAVAAQASADEFDRLEGKILTAAIENARPLNGSSLSAGEASQLPRVLRDARQTVVLVKTDQGNIARLLVDFGLRNAAQAQNTSVPIAILERFDVFEPGTSGARIAKGTGMQLFDAFQVDLDTGQVVPDGFGADLVFRIADVPGGRLTVLPGATGYALATSPFTVSGERRRPTSDRTVAADDFAGRYRLKIGGQWSGPLELAVDGDQQVKGRFRSDESGGMYTVTGRVERGAVPRLELRIEFPRSEINLVGYLSTPGRNEIAGVATFLDRPTGFHAAREDAPADTAGARVVTALDPFAIIVDVDQNGGLSTSSGEVDDNALAALMHERTVDGTPPSVLLRVNPGTPYSRVASVLKSLLEMQVENVRLAPAGSP